MFLLASSVSWSAGTTSDSAFLYLENIGTKVSEFRWSRASAGEQEVITVDEEGATFVNRCDRLGRTLSWQFHQEPGTDIEIVRTGNQLRFAGTLHDKHINRTESIDDRPWYQPLSFSLRSFLDSPQNRISFWTVRSDNLELVAMQAEKRGTEEVMVSGRNIQARKIRIRREGLLASLWHATFWFRENDHLFVRYQAVHGPPGTSETVVQLAREL
jgi:hypothetical protein